MLKFCYWVQQHRLFQYDYESMKYNTEPIRDEFIQKGIIQIEK